jgi:hypothetical protein
MSESAGTGQRKKRADVFLCIAGVLVAMVVYAPPAYAYVDPGTGGLVLQLLLGGVAGALVIVKLYWEKLTGLFRRGKNADAAVSEAGVSDRDE